MEQASEATGTPVPQTDDGLSLCLSYHLKGVCNSNCGGCHTHRTLSSHAQGVLRACKSRYCAEQPPVAEIVAPPWEPGGGSVGNTTLSTRSWRYQGTRGARRRKTKTWYTPPPPNNCLHPQLEPQSNQLTRRGPPVKASSDARQWCSPPPVKTHCMTLHLSLEGLRNSDEGHN